jgi:hypothetical protein
MKIESQVLVATVQRERERECFRNGSNIVHNPTGLGNTVTVPVQPLSLPDLGSPLVLLPDSFLLGLAWDRGLVAINRATKWQVLTSSAT